MSRRTVIIELRDKEVEIEFTLTEPDPSVGITNFGFEDHTISYGSELLDWALTDDEEQKIYDAIDEMMYDDDSPHGEQ